MIMKKFLICCVTISLFAILAGCGNNSGLTYTTGSSSESADMENTSTDKSDTEYSYITATSEALTLLKQYDLHASMNYMVHFAIADSEGNSVAVEYIDDEMIAIDTPVLTNFYLAEGEKNDIGTEQSHTRFEILTKTLEENSDMTIPEVRDRPAMPSGH